MGSDHFEERCLPGIDWNIAGQLELLDTFHYSEELADLQGDGSKLPAFRFNNGAFEPGDAEYWYQIIRHAKPMRIFEIGSGNSTLLAINAIRKNRSEDPSYRCEHVCIEPYEVPWLEQAGVTVIRKKVEEIGVSLFAELNENDILFIDSSHIIRPRGGGLFEYRELLPSRKKGVIVHGHDIFSPRNYPSQWLNDEVRLWNEQYLLEAFLTNNGHWKILGALNYLRHNHYERLKSATPFLTPEREPGSLYIQRIQ